MEELLSSAEHNQRISFKSLLQHWVAYTNTKKSTITSLLRLLKHYKPDPIYDSLPATGQQLLEINGEDCNSYGMVITFDEEDYEEGATIYSYLVYS